MSSAAFWRTTPRLGLRHFTEEDLDWLADLQADEDVMRYLGGPRERSQSEEMLRVRVLDYYDRHPGLGTWVTVERATNAPIGFHLLNHIQGESFIQVGFVLAKTAWGFGYGTEMAFEILRYGFSGLGLSQIVAIANLQNYASQHVLTKIELHRNGERAFPHPAYSAAGPMAWFERERDAWLADVAAMRRDRQS